GAPIALDRATLSIASRTFDLTSHLEWRALMFHESTGQAAALYQATWIRQNGAEVVLVAPMPASIVPREPNAHREASGRLGRALTRDLRLLQSPAEPPPARDVRVAIDRPFMMAVRRVLDEAPLASRVALPAPREAAAQRDSII
ncbi:MAG: IMP dehydrogenase, partial [Labilithrix sp.]|nr:IMP dehydrogenase [Labilithrix sp.]